MTETASAGRSNGRPDLNPPPGSGHADSQTKALAQTQSDPAQTQPGPDPTQTQPSTHDPRNSNRGWSW